MAEHTPQKKGMGVLARTSAVPNPVSDSLPISLSSAPILRSGRQVQFHMVPSPGTDACEAQGQRCPYLLLLGTATSSVLAGELQVLPTEKGAT